jgi:hypothetical protein
MMNVNVAKTQNTDTFVYINHVLLLIYY